MKLTITPPKHEKPATTKQGNPFAGFRVLNNFLNLKVLLK